MGGNVTQASVHTILPFKPLLATCFILSKCAYCALHHLYLKEFCIFIIYSTPIMVQRILSLLFFSFYHRSVSSHFLNQSKFVALSVHVLFLVFNLDV